MKKAKQSKSVNVKSSRATKLREMFEAVELAAQLKTLKKRMRSERKPGLQSADQLSKMRLELEGIHESITRAVRFLAFVESAVFHHSIGSEVTEEAVDELLVEIREELDVDAFDVDDGGRASAATRVKRLLEALAPTSDEARA